MSHVTTRNLKLTHCLRRLLYRRNAALALMAPGLAFAGPSGEVVVGGEADIVRPDANNTVINQFTHRAAINWQTFSVDADEYVIFNQPDASSIMLNRVIGGDASYILGHLQSNGQVFLLNPHGVYFTHGASLDVQGFLASTLDMNPNDFMAGDFTLTRSDSAPATGRVINDGEITAGPGGYVVLAGDYTENTGIITANAGTVALVSGNTLTLDIEGDGLVSFAIDEATLSDAAGVRNAGSLIADGGMVVMTAQVANNLTATAVNNEGLVRAHSVEQRDGEIWLVGHGGDVTNSGTLDADGENADGGKIIMYSDRNITLSDSAVQTAAGDENHSGGFMRFVAEDHLDYQGDNLIRATGGMSGGFVEVSGHGTLNILGVPQLGPGGRLMIDPSIVALRNGTAAPFGSSAFSPVFGPCTDAICSGSATILTTGWIATQLGSGVDVTLVASNTILLDETLVPVNLVATGSGDLTMTIGTVSAPNGATGFGLPPGGTTSQDEGAWTGGPPTVTSMSGGDIKLAGLNISIAGNFSANADQGQIALGEISANNVAVDAGSLGSANVIGGGFNGIAATGNVTITGNVVNVSYFETGNNVTVNGNFSGSNLYVGSSLATTAVANFTLNGAVNVSSAVWVNVANGGGITVSGNIAANSAVTFDAQATGTLNFGGGIFTPQVVTMEGNVTSNGLLIGSSGQRTQRFTLTGDANVSGNVNIWAGGLSSTGINISGGVNADGNVNMHATAGSTAVAPISVGGGIVAGGAVNLFASASNASASINVANVSATGNAVFQADGTNVTIAGGNISANHIDVHATPALNGTGNITLGTLSANGSGVANEDIVVQVDAAGGSSSSGNITIGGATTADGEIVLIALGSAAGQSGNITVTGAMNADDFIKLSAPGNIATQGMTVSNADSTGFVGADAGRNGTAATLTVNGGINVSGRGGGTFGPIAADVILNTGMGGSISVSGNIAVTGAAGAFSFPGSNGSMGAGNVGAHAGSSGNVSLGNVGMNVVGAARIDVTGGNVSVGDITVDVAQGDFTFSSTVSSAGTSSTGACGGDVCDFTRTESFTGGRAEISLFGAGGTLDFGSVDLDASTAHFGAGGYSTINGGGITIATNAAEFTQTSTGTYDGATVDLVDSATTGFAGVFLDTSTNGAVTLSNAVSLGGAGFMNFDVRADTIKLRDVTATATAGTFARSGTPGYGFDDDAGAFGHGGMGPRIDTGTITGGGARVALSGFDSVSTGSVGATSVEVAGNVTVAAPGGAEVRIVGQDITVSGAIRGTATRAQQDGSFESTYFDSGLGTSVTEAGTVVSSYGQAGISIEAGDLAPGVVRIGSITLAGPGGGGHVSGSDVRIGAISLTGSGGDLDIEETRSYGTTTEQRSFDGPGFLTGLALEASGALAITGDISINAIGAGGVLLGGSTITTRDITVNVADGNYTVMSPELFNGAVTDFTAGNAILGIAGATAQVNGNVSITAGQRAHFGGAANVSGNFSINAGTGITRAIPATVQFLNRINDNDDASIVLPTTFNVQASNIDLDTVAGPLVANGAALRASNALTLSTGGNMSVSNVTFSGATVRMSAGGNITNSNPAGSITAGALAIFAGGNVNLANTVLTVGSGSFADITGDTLFLQLLAAEDVVAPTAGPSLSIRGRAVSLGTISVAGDYILLETDALQINGTVSTSDPDLLLQVAPFATGTTFGFERTTGTGTSYVYDGTLDLFDAATIALGTTSHTGDAFIGTNGEIDIGDTNLFVLTSGKITGLERVVSSGIVKDLFTLINGTFDVPQTNEIDTSQDSALTLNDQYALDGGGTDEEEEGEEEGEDTDSDADVEEDDDSLIRQDTVDEEMMCR